MPAISISFNRYFGLLALFFPVFLQAANGFPVLSSSQLQWLGERIYQNECSARFQCLTSWNEGEDFPSLGIGHFIWYRAGQNEVFEETFPQLLAFYRQQDITLPDWIDALPGLDSPWQTREHFLQELNSERSMELRQFLFDTQSTQVDFIVQRLQNRLPELLATAAGETNTVISSRFYQVAASEPPYGIYALLDYLHFKGSGVDSKERYQGQGWGLLQVLLGMEQNTLEDFVRSAEMVLTQRVVNAPPQRNEQRWLPGWKNRVQSYLPDYN